MLPAERAWWRPAAARRKRRSARTERPWLPMQTKRTFTAVSGGGGRVLPGARPPRPRATAVVHTRVRVRRQAARRRAWRGRVEPLLDELADRCDEARVRAGGLRPDEAEPELGGELGRLGVEVVQHFDMVGEEPERRRDDGVDAACAKAA